MRSSFIAPDKLRNHYGLLLPKKTRISNVSLNTFLLIFTNVTTIFRIVPQRKTVWHHAGKGCLYGEEGSLHKPISLQIYTWACQIDLKKAEPFLYSLSVLLYL